MERLSKFLCLSAEHQRILIKAMFWVWVIRGMLWLLPFRLLRRLLVKTARASVASENRERELAQRVVWAVTIVSRYVPLATCLTQALTTKVLLGRNGYPASVHIGVARTESGELQAHAWVESCGSVVIGGSEASLKQFTPLVGSDGILW